MRMQFGSGLGGLAGMRPLTSMSHLLNVHTPQAQQLGVVRPFLGLTRDDLQSFCTDNDLQWLEDPSNTDEKYMRTRMRNLLNGAGAATQVVACAVQTYVAVSHRDALQTGILCIGPGLAGQPWRDASS